MGRWGMFVHSTLAFNLAGSAGCRTLEPRAVLGGATRRILARSTSATNCPSEPRRACVGCAVWRRWSRGRPLARRRGWSGVGDREADIYELFRVGPRKARAARSCWCGAEQETPLLTEEQGPLRTRVGEPSRSGPIVGEGAAAGRARPPEWPCWTIRAAALRWSCGHPGAKPTCHRWRCGRCLAPGSGSLHWRQDLPWNGGC